MLELNRNLFEIQLNLYPFSLKLLDLSTRIKYVTILNLFF